MVSMVAGLSISCALVLAEGVQSAKHSAYNLLAFVRSLHWHWPVGALDAVYATHFVWYGIAGTKVRLQVK